MSDILDCVLEDLKTELKHADKTRYEHKQGCALHHTAGKYGPRDGMEREYFVVQALAQNDLVSREAFEPLQKRFIDLVKYDFDRLEERVRAYSEGYKDREFRAKCIREGAEQVWLEALARILKL